MLEFLSGAREWSSGRNANDRVTSQLEGAITGTRNKRHEVGVEKTVMTSLSAGNDLCVKAYLPR